MKKITLLPSAAYVSSELAAEYGRLPPAFLPVGHQRLYELQVASLLNSKIQTHIFLTIPQSFHVPSADRNWFIEHQVELIVVPDDLSLSESILFALEMIELPYDELNILHGDTLIYDLPFEKTDVVAVGPPPDGYSWGALSHEGLTSINADQPKKMVLAGYFAFSNSNLFRRSLARSQGHFIKAVELYCAELYLTDFEVKNWLDFGHLQTFYRARCQVKTQRSFNELSINFREICKSSSNEFKILAESHWFDAIPAHLRMFTPALLGQGMHPRPWYKLEYLPIPSLHELFVFGEIEEGAWRHILDACFIFMRTCLEVIPGTLEVSFKSPLELLVLSKTAQRLDEFLKERNIDPNTVWCYEGAILPPLHEIAKITSNAIHFENPRWQGVMHGDLCFTNIFYDFRTQKIRVIDPRGTVDDLTPSILGDVRYDMAKLGQSIFGGYDFILANRYTCQGFDERNLSIQINDGGVINNLVEISKVFNLNGLGIDGLETRALIIHLFLSMLPLHSDRPDRQEAFLASALRLYLEGFN